MNSNGFIRLLIAALIAVGFFTAASAADKFPSREIQVITTNPPGGVVDIAVRLMADNLGKNLGVPIVVNNRPGAGGTSGTLYLIKSKPDGYTIGSISSKDAVLVPATIPEVPYKYTDLEPLCKYVFSPTIVFCRNEAPWKSLEDLVADARKRPGKITYAATTHSVSHFMMEAFQKTAGMNMMHIPLQSAGQSITRVLGGNLDIGITGLAPAMGQIKAGALRPLFVVAPARLDSLPQTPTLMEKGYREPIITLYTGFYAPRGLPKPVRATLEKALEKTIKAPALKKKLEEAGELTLDYTPSTAFAKEIEADYQLVTKLAKTMSSQK